MVRYCKICKKKETPVKNPLDDNEMCPECLISSEFRENPSIGHPEFWKKLESVLDKKLNDKFKSIEDKLTKLIEAQDNKIECLQAQHNKQEMEINNLKSIIINQQKALVHITLQKDHQI